MNPEDDFLLGPMGTYAGPRTAGDVAYGAGATGLLFAPGAGVTDLMGYAPDPFQPGEYLPSFGANIREGNYLDAALQTLGGAGDVMMAGGAVFPPLAGVGAAMKAPRAARVASRAEDVSLTGLLEQKYPDVDVSISEVSDGISVNKVVVPEAQRSQGVGTSVMNDIIAYADRTGQPIGLTPDTAFGGASKARLTDFYKRFGFVPNKGRNKDFAFRETMVRQPSLLEEPVAPASIRAYHGSPYDFDKFDISKIGTGEGAQMYGRGLYFAESPDVARSYRDELTEVPFEYQVDGKPVSEMYNDALKNEDYELAEVLEQVQLHDTPTDLKERFTTEAGYSQKTEDYVKGLDYDNIKGFDPDGNEVPLGRQYEVEIAADPEMMLDYQSALVDQPKAVQDAYKSIFFDKYQRNDVLSELFPTVDDMDMQSVGLLGRSTGGQAYKTLASTLGSEQAANEALLKAGIPGVKYLDLGSRFGAKSLKDATHNYVIFDDETINILRKYGLLAPLVGGGTAAAVMGADEPQPAGGIL